MSKQNITFYHLGGSRTLKAFKDSVPSNLHDHIKFVPCLRKDVPARLDLVVQAGDGEPSKQQHIMARNLANSMLVCLPQANAWLVAKILNAIESGKKLALADAALATSNKLFE